MVERCDQQFDLMKSTDKKNMIYKFTNLYLPADFIFIIFLFKKANRLFNRLINRLIADSQFFYGFPVGVIIIDA